MEISELEKLSTDEIIQEIKNRHKAVVILLRDYKDRLPWSAKGQYIDCMGLLANAMYEIPKEADSEKAFTDNDEEDDDA